MATNLRSFAELVASINKYSAEVQEETKEIIAFHTSEMELEARRDAPGPGEMIGTENGPESEAIVRQSKSARPGTVPISQAIGSIDDASGYKGTVFVERSAGPIAAWVEFGTGQSAAYYLTTVPPEWKALAQKYYINGKGTILAKPYLLPAFFKHNVLVVKELKEMLKDKGL